MLSPEKQQNSEELSLLKSFVRNHLKLLNSAVSVNMPSTPKNIDIFFEEKIDFKKFQDLSDQLIFAIKNIKPEIKVKDVKEIHSPIYLIDDSNEKNFIYTEIRSLYERLETFIKKHPDSNIKLINYNKEELPKSDEIFAFLKFLILYLNKREQSMQFFEKEKNNFLEEFKKETEELSVKWKEFDKQKQEFKTRLEEEKNTLYNEINEEHKKLLDENMNTKKNKTYFNKGKSTVLNYFTNRDQDNLVKKNKKTFLIIFRII